MCSPGETVHLREPGNPRSMVHVFHVHPVHGLWQRARSGAVTIMHNRQHTHPGTATADGHMAE